MNASQKKYGRIRESQVVASLARVIIDPLVITGVQHTANRIIREIMRLSGVSEPYHGFKQREMKHARKVIDEIGDRLGSDFRSLVSLAVLGNSLDFFTYCGLWQDGHVK